MTLPTRFWNSGRIPLQWLNAFPRSASRGKIPAPVNLPLEISFLTPSTPPRLHRKMALEGPENLMEHQERQMWEAEEKTWVLLSQLYQIRTKPHPEPLDLTALKTSMPISFFTIRLHGDSHCGLLLQVKRATRHCWIPALTATSSCKKRL